MYLRGFSSSSSFLLRHDHGSDLFPLIASYPPPLALSSLLYLPYTLVSFRSVRILSSLRSFRREPTLGLYSRTRTYTRTRPGPLNLTWQVPAEWTRLGSPPPCSSFLSPYFPMPRRFSAYLTFSVLPIYSALAGLAGSSLSSSSSPPSLPLPLSLSLSLYTPL